MIHSPCLVTEFDLEEFKKLYEREVVKSMRDGSVPGMSVLITRNGETIYERNFGSREWTGTKPATSDTLYGIASMTKSMTCVAILMLHEQGKLSINDPISKYILVKLQKDDKPISIHHLMSHSSGLPNLGSYEVSIRNEDLTTFNGQNIPMGNWDDFYFYVNHAQDWLLSDPEEKFYYNNDGFTMLSQIIAKVSGVRYEDFMTDNLLRPLGMTRSTFSRADLELDNDASKGYSSKREANRMKREPKPHLSSQFNSGAGGLNSSTSEMTKYLQFHLNNGQVGDRQLLSPQLLNKMYEPHNKHILSENFLLYDDHSSYGYGLSIIENYHGYKLIRHGGASGVAGGVIIFIPELNITYTHLYNVGWFTMHLAHIALYSLLGINPKEIPFLKRRSHYRRLQGEYSSYMKNIQGKIILKDGLLYLETDIIEKSSVPLVPVNPKDPEPLTFYLYGPYGRLSIPFFIHEDSTITFDFERNVMKKVEYRPELE